MRAARNEFPETDKRYVAAVTSLGHAYFALGLYRDAEPVQRSAVTLNSRLLPWSPELAASLADLAETMQLQGRYEDAEPLFRRALAIRERHFGSDHPLVAESLDQLAGTLRAMEEYPDAERLYWRSYMIRSYLKGVDSGELWPTLKAIADIKRAVGRPAEADQLYARASSIAEKTLPPSLTRARLNDFPSGDTETAATARGSSVSLMLMPGTHIGERQALQATERPEVARRLESLSEIYAAQGRTLQAIDLMRRVISIRERVMGSSHPETERAYRVMNAMLAQQRGAPAPAAKSVPAPAQRRD